MWATASPAPEDRVVPLSAKDGRGCGSRRRPAPVGVEHMTARSARVGLASELTSRSVSTTDVMLAGNWKMSRMVAHLLGRRDRGNAAAVARHL